MSSRRTTALILVVGTLAFGSTAAPAAAFNPLHAACRVGGATSGLLGKACDAATQPGRILKAGKKLLGGHLGGFVDTLVGGGSSAAAKTVGIAAIGAWVLGGASFALHETVKLVSKTTSPQLRTTWFSSTYWGMAGIAAMLTLPFLFAAAVQALLRSDLTLLIRAAFGYLPLAMLAVGIAAPLTMLLLAVSDQMSAAVSAASGDSGTHFLAKAGFAVGGLSAIAGAPFIAFFIGLLTAAGAVVLWIELLMRDAAVYVIVLMLPLVFAALVWPSRRVWAVRAVELLVALIFAKFAIVAVLSLGGAAFNGSAVPSVAGWLAGLVILVLGAFAPWALLRLLPLAELASNAVRSIHGDARAVTQPMNAADGLADRGREWATTTFGQMRRDREAASEGLGRTPPPPLPAIGPGSDPGGDEPQSRAAPEGPDPQPGPAGPDPQPGPAGPDPQPGPSGPDSPPADEGSSQPESRPPELGARWQGDRGSWRTLRLGLEESWPSPVVWTPGGADVPRAATGTAAVAAPPAPSAGPGAVDESGFGGGAPRPLPSPNGSAPRATKPESTHDDADPLPPAQDPPQGRL
jgi:hypothetical protein